MLRSNTDLPLPQRGGTTSFLVVGEGRLCCTHFLFGICFLHARYLEYFMAIELNAELRADQGKGASRRLRHTDKLPAIIYGAGKDAVNLMLTQRDVRAVMKNQVFYSSIVHLKVAGKTEQVVLRDIQHHPYKVDIMHMDFQRVDANKKLHIHVPLHFINEDKSPGVKLEGGIVSHVVIEIEVECLPKDIPEFIEVDVSGLHTNHAIHLSELKMPAGVEIRALRHGADHDSAVVSIHPPKQVVEEAPAAVAEAEAAPAAAAAAPADKK
jgi:large subunit ribosomal protein L25